MSTGPAPNRVITRLRAGISRGTLRPSMEKPDSAPFLRATSSAQACGLERGRPELDQRRPGIAVAQWQRPGTALALHDPGITQRDTERRTLQPHAVCDAVLPVGRERDEVHERRHEFAHAVHGGLSTAKLGAQHRARSQCRRFERRRGGL